MAWTGYGIRRVAAYRVVGDEARQEASDGGMWAALPHALMMLINSTSGLERRWPFIPQQKYSMKVLR